MKHIRNLRLIVVLGLAVMAFASCYKHDYLAYIHNETDQGVTLEWTFNNWDDSVTTFRVEAHETKSFDELGHWHIVQRNFLEDSVVFHFDDGRREVHRYVITIDSLGCGTTAFYPERNNIMCGDVDPYPGWEYTSLGQGSFRHDYYIRHQE